MKLHVRILFASFAAIVVVALVGSTCMAADPIDPAKQAALKTNIVKFAQSKLGTKVDLGQGGESTELIVAGLKQYGGQPMLKTYGFETQNRRVKGNGGSVKVFLFARLTKETRTAYTAAGKRDGLNREIGAIADMVYGGSQGRRQEGLFNEVNTFARNAV